MTDTIVTVLVTLKRAQAEKLDNALTAAGASTRCISIPGSDPPRYTVTASYSYRDAAHVGTALSLWHTEPDDCPYCGADEEICTCHEGAVVG